MDPQVTVQHTVSADRTCPNRISVLRAYLERPHISMVLLASAVLSAGLGQGDIRIDAPIYAWIAKYMLLSGDWFNLYYDHGQTPYFNKPPLQFWLMAAVFKLLGASTFSAKLVPVLFAIGCVILLYVLARLRYDPKIAATAGIIFATTYPFVRNAAGARLDAAVTFFFLATLYAGLRILLSTKSRMRNWVMLGAACGLGLLIKSGVGLLSLPILAVASLWQRRWNLWLDWRVLVALFVCGIIVAPWHWHQYATWGQPYIDEHFKHQVAGRLEADAFGASPWYTYLLEIGKRYWPWLPFAAFGMWRLPSSRPYRAEERVFITWFLLAFLILHLIQRKYDRYLLLIFPVLAIFAAYGLRQTRLWSWWEFKVLPHAGWALVTLVIVLGLFTVPLHSTKYPELAQTIVPINRAQAGKSRPAVYAQGIGVSAECAIRFYTEAKVVSATNKPRFEPGDILVLPRGRESRYYAVLPPHEVLARGKTLAIYRISDSQ